MAEIDVRCFNESRKFGVLRREMKDVPGSSLGGIFLSYRREDAAPYARLLQFQLAERFPEVRVFMDLDSIEAGLDFAEVIREAVESCAVLVALIGRQWVTLADNEGRRRLDNPDDFVRFEVGTALKRGLRVIPVLVDGAEPLKQQLLPAELHKLARLNALELSYGRYQYDADRLLDLIRGVLATASDTKTAHRSPPTATVAMPPLGLAPSPGDLAWAARLLTDAEPRKAQNVVKLFMDESGNGNPREQLIVGAVELGDDADDVEEQVRDLYKRLCARGSLVGLPGFEEFRKNGFHSATDPREVSGPFLELIRALFFRAYMVATDRTSVPGDTEDERIEFMYIKLLSDLLIRHRNKAELLCYIEQSEGMKSIIRRLPDSATRRACQTLGKAAPLPELKITMVAKTDYMSMPIVDYVMSAVTRWLRAGCTTRPEDYPYRAFREIEPFISILYSFEHGRISSRKDPLH